MSSPRPRRVGIVFGGANSEHEVSCASAASIVDQLDRSRFEPVLLGIDRRGGWHRVASVDDLEAVAAERHGRRLPELGDIDIALPILHGRFGEDGTVQGLLDFADVPYVGNGVLASAVAMDKLSCQRILRAAGLPTVQTRSVGRDTRDDATEHARALGFPLFVKPNRAGSSVGASRVESHAALRPAVDAALAQDNRALLQELETGDEVDVAVLQRVDGSLAVGPPLRVRVASGAPFFDYSTKYSAGAVEFEIPASMPAEVRDAMAEMALDAFAALGCEGLARVDFFLRADGSVVINEVNTMPGMTSFSQYPRMWSNAGLEYRDLLTILLDRGWAARW